MTALLLALALLAPANPAATQAPGPDGSAVDRRAIRQLVVAWRNAWEQRDIDAYLRCIGADYHAGTLDRAGLGAQKAAIFARTGGIEVGVEGLGIEVEGDRARASFRQNYVSDRHRDRGQKSLTLAREDGRWLIVGESFTPEP